MDRSTPRLRRWQASTLFLLVIGYAGYYLCRSDYSVSLPLLIRELGASGLSADDARIRLGSIASLGVLAYAFGKFLSGGLADFMGGKRNFVMGMAGSVIFTLTFALTGTLPLFTLAWVGNRIVQSMGWVGMVKVSSKWFAFSMYGTVMGILSLSFLFGDAASRAFMGMLIAHGMGWRGLFYTAAGVLFVLLLLNAFLLKESPRDVGEEEPPANPANLFGEAGEDSTPPSLKALLIPLLRSPAFWLVCLLSLGFTLLRETFNTWTPTYFTQAVGLTEGDAASKSALFPLLGGVSVLVAGFVSDRMGRGGRAGIILGGLLLTTFALLTLARANFGGSHSAPVWLVAGIGFVMIGPYSYLAGAVALDFGGKQGCSTACGFIDGVGYLGGVLAGDTVARISVSYGWQGAFTALAMVAAASSVAALLYVAHMYRAPAFAPALQPEEA